MATVIGGEVAETGVGALFRSKSIVGIVRYVTSRRIKLLRIVEIERELHMHSQISRSAVDNAIEVLASAGLMRISKAQGARVGEVQMPRVWAKLGELFEVERAASLPAGVGMPWLADVVGDAPRRQRLRAQPAVADSDVAIETVEAALAMMPEVEPTPAARRSPAPGRRR